MGLQLVLQALGVVQTIEDIDILTRFSRGQRLVHGTSTHWLLGCYARVDLLDFSAGTPSVTVVALRLSRHEWRDDNFEGRRHLTLHHLPG